MDSERYQFINLFKMPNRLSIQETAWLLGFATHDIPPLVAYKLLKPLGNPPPNGARYFASSEIEGLRLDAKWLNKASAMLEQFKVWCTYSRNGKRSPGRPGVRPSRRRV